MITRNAILCFVKNGSILDLVRASPYILFNTHVVSFPFAELTQEISAPAAEALNIRNVIKHKYRRPFD